MHGTFDEIGARRAAEEIDAVAIVVAAREMPRRRGIDPAMIAVIGLLAGLAVVFGLAVA